MKKAVKFSVRTIGCLALIFIAGCNDRDTRGASPNTNSIAKSPPLNRKAQDKLIQAVTKGDVKSANEALAAGAVPDAGLVTNERPIAVATRLIGKNAPRDNIEERFQVFAALCQNLRHRDRQIIELLGNVKVTLVSSGAGQYHAKAFIETSGGKSHQIEVAMRETKFSNIELNDWILPLHFDQPYRLRGSFSEDKFEVEKMELVIAKEKRTSSNGSPQGMSIPLQSVFPSSAKFVQQFLLAETN